MLNWFLTCLSTTAYSRAISRNKKEKSASWTDILSYKCVTGRDSVMALSWSWLCQALESPPLKRISKILKRNLWIVSVSWPLIRIIWCLPFQSTSMNMKINHWIGTYFPILSVPSSEEFGVTGYLCMIRLVWIPTNWISSLIVFGPHSQSLRTSTSLYGLALQEPLKFWIALHEPLKLGIAP